MSNSNDSGFVEDGQERARLAVEPAIRAEVESEYADRVASASWWGRRRLRVAMRKEILRRIEEQAPPDALY